MQGLGDTSAFDTFDRMAERIAAHGGRGRGGAELAGELSGDTLESKFRAARGGRRRSEDDALSELKAKMGLLEAPKGDNAKQLGAGAVGGEGTTRLATSAQRASLGSLTAEDLKELEDLDLAELEKELKGDAKAT